MKKNYLKIGLIALALAGMVAPLAVGMAVERPVTKIERCTLRHDFSKQFGDKYKDGATISASLEALAGAQQNIIAQTGGTGAIEMGSIIVKVVDMKKVGTGAAGWLQVVGFDSLSDGWEIFKSAASSIIGASIDVKCQNTVTTIQNMYSAGDSGLSLGATDYDAIKANCVDAAGTNIVKKLQKEGGDKMLWAMREAAKINGHVVAGSVAGGVVADDAAIVCLLDLIETVGDWLFAVVLIFAGIFILWGGATMVFAAGAPEKIKKARDILIWAGVGVAVAFLSKGLIKLVEQIIA